MFDDLLIKKNINGIAFLVECRIKTTSKIVEQESQ